VFEITWKIIYFVDLFGLWLGVSSINVGGGTRTVSTIASVGCAVFGSS